MNFFKKITSRIPSQGELEHISHTFSKRERIIFFGLLFALIASVVGLLGIIQKSFLIERPEYGGTMTEGIVGTPRFINPVIELSDGDKDIASLVYSGLVRKTPTGEIIPDLAGEYHVSNDGLMYTFTIRDDAVFHDGKPVTSDDVLFTISLVKDPILKSPKKQAWDGVTLTRIDDKTITFSLKQPFSSFLSSNMTLGILPKHIWEDVTAEQFSFSQHNIEAVGSGPYAITNVEYKQSGIISEIELTAFRKFTLGRPYIRKIRFSFYVNEKDLISGLKEGKIGQAGTISPESAKELEKSGHVIESAILPRIFGLFFNQNKAPLFTDKNITRALDLAIDKNRIVDEVLLGYGIPIDSPLPHTRNTTAPTLLERDGALEEARALLKKSGWSENEEGVLEKTSGKETERLSFTITTGDTPDLVKTGTIIKENLAEIGIDVVLNIFEVGTLNQTIIRPREYDVLLFGQIVNSESDLFAFWHSSRRNDPGLNIALYTNSKVDTLLEEALVTTDKEERAEKYTAIETEIKNDSPALFLYSPSFLYAMNGRIKGADTSHIATSRERFSAIYDWYIRTEKVWKIFENNTN